MKLRVNVKSVSKRRNAVEETVCEIAGCPGTVGELIAAVVDSQVEEYNQHLEQSKRLMLDPPQGEGLRQPRSQQAGQAGGQVCGGGQGQVGGQTSGGGQAVHLALTTSVPEVLACLTREEIEDQAERGKISFGISYGEKRADRGAARKNALQCFEDGIYRIFMDGQPLEGLEDKIVVTEDKVFTFVRLTMLTGRMW